MRKADRAIPEPPIPEPPAVPLGAEPGAGLTGALPPAEPPWPPPSGVPAGAATKEAAAVAKAEDDAERRR